MFSKELEEVIEAALADGTITEKERAVLHKRAIAEGVDLDELDVIIDGRLSKMKQENDWQRPVPPPQPAPANNGKHGVVRKCPSCGAPVEAGTIKCAECGYEFVGVEATNSIVRLANLLETKESQEKKIDIINNFPVPTVREDLLDFITAMRPKSFYAGCERETTPLIRAYKNKYEECIDKAKVFFGTDPQFILVLEQYKKDKKKFWANLTDMGRTGIILLAVYVVLGLICVVWGALKV